ncbi:MAG: lipocalin-like domain-containing protein [Bacteroidales bacterium]|nr:lipocalin-like domain-containing protein [Candidatus Physcousia equi]
MKTARHTLYIIIALLLALSSCESHRDNNGELGGNWQLIRWETRGTETGHVDQVVCGAESKIFYAIHRKLFKFSAGNTVNYHLSYFENENNTLSFYHITHYPTDSLCTASDLAKYGVPASGQLHIDKIGGESLVLSDKDNRLTFRRY